MKKMKKKLSVLMFVGVISLLSMAPALAQEKRSATTKFLVEGEITAIGDTSFTVQVWDGEGAAERYIGQELTLQVEPKTKYRYCQSRCMRITFADLEVGDLIDPAIGKASGEVFTIKSLRVDDSI